MRRFNSSTSKTRSREAFRRRRYPKPDCSKWSMPSKAWLKLNEKPRRHWSKRRSAWRRKSNRLSEIKIEALSLYPFPIFPSSAATWPRRTTKAWAYILQGARYRQESNQRSKLRTSLRKVSWIKVDARYLMVICTSLKVRKLALEAILARKWTKLVQVQSTLKTLKAQWCRLLNLTTTRVELT